MSEPYAPKVLSGPRIRIYVNRFMVVDDGNGGSDTQPTSESEDLHVWESYDGDVTDWAFDTLRSEGTDSFSSSDFQTHEHAWYGYADGSIIANNYTSEREKRSAFLLGFTVEQRRAVYDLIQVSMRR